MMKKNDLSLFFVSTGSNLRCELIVIFLCLPLGEEMNDGNVGPPA